MSRLFLTLTLLAGLVLPASGTAFAAAHQPSPELLTSPVTMMVADAAQSSSGTLTSASPAVLNNNSTGNTITLTGTGTTWTSSNPTFSLTGGTGASITSQSIQSDTSATVVISAGTADGTLTITDSSTSTSASVNVADALFADFRLIVPGETVTIPLTGGNTHWTTTNPTFTLTGASAATITGQTITSDTTATITVAVTAGAADAAPLLTDPSTFTSTSATPTSQLTMLLHTPQTYFIRVDGGNRYDMSPSTPSSQQFNGGACDGLADAAYSGSGTNQHCAFFDIRYMWNIGTYGNWQWLMKGGDTLVVRGCHALSTQQNPDEPHCRIGNDTDHNPNNPNFSSGADFWNRGTPGEMPTIPSGSPTHPTIIEGGCAYGSYNCTPILPPNQPGGYPYASTNEPQLYGGFGLGQVISLFYGGRYINLIGLEITSHSTCSAVGDVRVPHACVTSTSGSGAGQVVDDFSKWGIAEDNTSANIMLQDVYIHGMAVHAAGGAIGGHWVLNRVNFSFNAYMGWNFDNGQYDAPNTTLHQSYVTMIGNGCKEEYPIVHTQFPADACWDSGTGGFGDSWSGQGSQMLSWDCDHCYVAYNTKDGGMGPHTSIKHLSITNSTFFGNMGQQGKWATADSSDLSQGATYLQQNNLIIGNCLALSHQIPGAKQNFNISTGLTGSRLTTFCRAGGDMWDFYSGPGSVSKFINNTVIGYNGSIYNLGCYPHNGVGCPAYIFSNNIAIGLQDTYAIGGPTPNGTPPGLYYQDGGASVVTDHNISYGVRNGDAYGQNGNINADPLLLGEPIPVYGDPNTPETALYRMNFGLASNSPARGAGSSNAGRTTDFTDAPATNDIGAMNSTSAYSITYPADGGMVVAPTGGIVFQGYSLPSF